MDRSSSFKQASQSQYSDALIDEAGISDELFSCFAALLSRRTGIVLKPYKKYLLVNRLARWVGAGKEHKDFEVYYHALQHDPSGKLMEQFVNALTTNYSFFFRDPIHFDVLAQYVVDRAASQEYFRFWSAASSTGEEAFSMAITLLKSQVTLPVDSKILATDISTKVLEQASSGRFPVGHVQKSVSAQDFRRFFYPENHDGYYQTREEVRRLISFRHFNLLSPYPFSKMMDVVFLRNVLIYFGSEEKELVVNRINDYLKPGGLLIIGLSESLVGVRHPLKMLRNSIYQK
jgi:chemotaxis protein methyltransferase CheR